MLPSTSSHSVPMGPLRRFPFTPGTTSHRRPNTARSQQRRQRKSGAGEGRSSGCIHETPLMALLSGQCQIIVNASKAQTSHLLIFPYRRNKVVNHFSIMLQRRLREQDRGEDDEEEGEKGGKKKKKKGGRGGDLRIHDLEEDLEMSSDESDGSNGDGEQRL